MKKVLLAAILAAFVLFAAPAGAADITIVNNDGNIEKLQPMQKAANTQQPASAGATQTTTNPAPTAPAPTAPAPPASTKPDSSKDHSETSPAIAGDPETQKLASQLGIALRAVATLQARLDQMSQTDPARRQMASQLNSWQNAAGRRLGPLSNRMSRLTGRRITQSGVIPMLIQARLLTSPWAQPVVSQAYASGLAHGRVRGGTSATEQGNALAKRQEAIAFAQRAKEQALQQAQAWDTSHKTWDDGEHQALREGINGHNLWLLILSIVLGLVILALLLYMLLSRKRCNDDDDDLSVGTQPGWPNSIGVPAGPTNYSAAGERCTLGRC